MTKARDLANLIAAGNPLADGAIAASEVSGLATVATSGAVADVTGAAPLASPTFTGDVTLPDKIVHTGDTNTAIRFADADTVTVETGGSERMRIDDSGRVNVAATTGNEKLNVAGALGVSGASANFSGGNERALVDFTGTLARFGHVNGSSGSAKDVSILSGGGEKFRFGSSGQLGIGGATYGTSGQVLTSGGASAAPTWADAGGGAYELIQKQTISSAVSSVTFTTTTAPQGQLVLILNGVRINADGIVQLAYRNSSGTLLNSDSNGDGYYETGAHYVSSADSGTVLNDNISRIQLNSGNYHEYLNRDIHSQINIFGWGTTQPFLFAQTLGTRNYDDRIIHTTLGGRFSDRTGGTTVPTQIHLYTQVATGFTTGNVYLYKLV